MRRVWENLFDREQPVLMRQSSNVIYLDFTFELIHPTPA